MSYYIEYMDEGIRPAQVETNYWEPDKHLIIKLYIQTDEEAGGVGADRRSMLAWLEGVEYLHNGEKGIYENVGKCYKAPREYAVKTIWVKSPNNVISLAGDWDYNVLKSLDLSQYKLNFS